jgi:predicted LPLAT superfamily acyltransferase
LHFLAFGEAILDKILGWTRDISEDEFDVINRTVLDTILADKRGQLIIGSHFGNLEFCRGFMSRNVDIPVNALIFDQHSGNFAHLMERTNPQSRVNLYQVTELDIPTIMTLKAKIDRGEWIVIVADRIPVGNSQRTVKVDFLGRPASFPIGPYILAATLQCPVNLMFAYRYEKSVTVEFVRVAEKIKLARSHRQTQLQQLAQDFALHLQMHVRRAPLQWFNFYPFWDTGTPPSGDPAT